MHLLHRTTTKWYHTPYAFRWLVCAQEFESTGKLKKNRKSIAPNTKTHSQSCNLIRMEISIWIYPLFARSLFYQRIAFNTEPQNVMRDAVARGARSSCGESWWRHNVSWRPQWLETAHAPPLPSCNHLKCANQWEARRTDSNADAAGSGFQTFPHRVPFVGAVLSPRTQLFRENPIYQILFDQRFGKLELTQMRHEQNGCEKL